MSDAETVWEAVAPWLPGFTVEVLPQVDSTNTELMRRARAGRCEPVLLVAGRQTAGRGRLGRAWHSNPGDSLTFSLGLPLAPTSWSGLSLAVGVALAESLHPHIRLKWPNDLWVDDRKLGGILIETAQAFTETAERSTVIGVGINVASPAAGALSTPPAWMRQLEPDAEAGALLRRVALPLVQAVLAFQASGFAAFEARFAARDALRGRPVILSDGTEGTARGVASDGALLVHTSAGMKSIVASEVSVRPAAGG